MVYFRQISNWRLNVINRYRNYIVCILFGAVLASVLPAGAAGLLSKGDKVAGIVSVDIEGKVIGSGAIINGTTYLPVRSMAEAMGGSVEPTKGKVSITLPTTEVDGSANVPIDVKIQKITNRLSDINRGIAFNQQQKEFAEKQIAALKEQGYTDFEMINYTLSESTNNLDKLTAEKAELEAQLQALQTQ